MDLFNFIKLGKILGVRFEKEGAIFSSTDSESFLNLDREAAHGIFKHLVPFKFDYLAIETAYKSQQEIGIPDGMSQRPNNITEFRLKYLKTSATSTTIKDNYFISTKKLIIIYQTIEYNFVTNWEQYRPTTIIEMITTIENHIELISYILEHVENIYDKLNDIYNFVVQQQRD